MERMNSLFDKRVNARKIKLIDKFLHNKSKILDIGCGNGLYGVHCREMGCDVTQIDIIDRRDSRAKDMKFEQADAEKYSQTGVTYDGVLAFDIIEHLVDDRDFLARCHQMMEKDGRVIISVPNEDNSLLERCELAHVHFTDKTHKREYSRASLQELLSKVGFKVLHCEPQYNSSIVNIPQLLMGDTFISKITAIAISYQLKVFLKLGLLKRKIIADWFIVGEK
jgi:predicted TPR repeat methyltransferase